MRRRTIIPLLAAVWTVLVLPACQDTTQMTEVKVGSKKFTESVILGELVTLLTEHAGAQAVHEKELGGTQVLWKALQRGDIDVYPEYTGTISHEILSGKGLSSESEIRDALNAEGILMSRPLGFNNTYAIGMKQGVASKYNVTKISDLRPHPELKFGFTSEFMDRSDGWPSLRDRYNLPHRDVQGLDHDVAYRGLESGSIHVTDLYSTDAEIQYYNLRVLEDDQSLFPNYFAVLLYRNDLEERAPKVVSALLELEGYIPEAEMVKMNARAKLEKLPENRVAADFLAKFLSLETQVHEETVFGRLLKNTLAHLFLVCVSLAPAILISIPLGILASRREPVGQVILGIVGIIQTIPALALLVFMIPLLGIKAPPAIAALFLYSLLPIVRNTYAGLHDIPSPIRESASALGLPPFSRLWLVEIPMASRAILAGIKTSAVINVGFATLGALIGAGGYGQPILTGIRKDDIGLILQGAVPAAVLALLVQGLFEMAERCVVSRGLRLKSES